MLKVLKVSSKDIVRNIKLACQIPHIVEAIAAEKIIADTARELGITVEEEELQLEGDRARLEKKLVKAKDTWAWLKKHHLSLDEFEEVVYNKVLSKKLADHLFSNQVERFFYEQQLNYVAAATYEVVLDDRDLALELFYALQEGEISFQEIARQYIQDPELRRASGYRGIRHRIDFRPDIATAVFAASPPQILKPITTPTGVYLILVEEIIQPQLNDKLRQTIITNLFSAWLQQQIQQQEIVVEIDSDNNSNSSSELLTSA
ncbi:peptidylprolyl isomerase [Aetokthonos hydrillicola Thurmond2011]|jgi:parvulin-like peptidyl-prolyl isomerase|uniref:peptidylprolyl isomerase n=1 Tax=Aetokthonos hydrillicola Thurmond2011 TaxID=2712845 RepID=A0AAP5I286_9CYAN|nr:peptidylprolyl isomerase [Aetokthonos hydrillicola]MBW4588130.1 peptidylprolyl isomerase [Aetokthonos hydrillicola CCALA 1050]MDR9893444.1 peptidylprolyl isomerase [Aetokthonos hydrillicola Thurmond2011]